MLGLPRVSFDSEKKYIFPFFKPFFNGLNGKIQNVKKSVIQSPLFAWLGSFSISEQHLYPRGHFHYVSAS